MKLHVSQIDANPHRDLVRNPVSEEQVISLVNSINRNKFWNNLVVRPHPDIDGRYQLAYGHNRIEACRRIGIEEVDLQVFELTEYAMFCCMVDENATQQQITPKIVFENVTAAISLAERLLQGADSVEEFNESLKTSHRSGGNDVICWRANEYEKAKLSIADDGNGLGKDFVKQFMPKGSAPSDETLQNAIDSYYADRRKRVADKREAESREKARQAEIERVELERQAREKREAELQAQREADEADRKQREADEAAKREADYKARLVAIEEAKKQRIAKEKAEAEAKKAKEEQERLKKASEKKAKESVDHSAKAEREKAKSERIDFAGVDRDLLEKLDSTSKMNDVVKLIKKHKIPKEYHAELIDAAIAWSPDGTSADKAGTSVSAKGFAWWDEKSGAKAKRFEDMGRKAKEEAMRKKFGEYPFETTVFKFVDDLKVGNSAPLANLVRCSDYFDSLNRERLDRLHKVLTEINQHHNEVMESLLGKINDLRIPSEKDITPKTKMLNDQRGNLYDGSIERDNS
jgi:ParB/RepB/Spo0J family partition protein